mgnify:CR=1 FL=1
MEKWVVNISQEQLALLDEEQRDLGTMLHGEDGKTQLVFRDGFVALKIATQLGTTRSATRLV